MALTWFWRCEGTTLDATDDYYGTSDNTATANNVPAIDAAAALVGSNGILIDAASEYYNFSNQTNPMVFSAAGSVGFWIRWQTFATGSRHWYVRANLSATQSLEITTIATSKLRMSMRNDAGGPINSDLGTITIATDTTYFVTASWDVAADLLRIRIYDSSGTLLDSNVNTVDLSAAQPAALDSPSGLRIGESAGVASSCYIDNVFIGDAYADADAFLTNRSITSYTQYGVGGATGLRPAICL